MTAIRSIARARALRVHGPDANPSVRMVTFGFKETSSKLTREPAVKFHVDRKRRRGDIPPAQRLPEFITLGDGAEMQRIATDVVVEPAEFQAFGLRTGQVILASDGDRGTSALAFDTDTGKYLITNAHVAYDIGPVLDPATSIFARGTDGTLFEIGRPIAANFYTGDVVTSDVAVIRLDDNVPVDEFMVVDSGAVLARKRFEYFSPLSASRFFYNVAGRFRECARPEKVLTDLRVSFDGFPARVRGAWKLKMIDGDVAAPGHSGSLIIRRGRGGAPWGSGLLFAGSANGSSILAFPMEGIIRRVERRVGAISGSF